MAEDLFVPYIQNLPPAVGQDYDEDEVFALNGSLEEVVAKGWRFQDFGSFLKDRVVFWTSDAAIVSYLDSPSNHEYTIDMIFPPTASSKKKTMHISGVNAESTAPVLSGLLEFFITSHEDEQEMEVIFKTFATNPRKPFGGLDLSSPSLTRALEKSSCRLALSFQFVSLSPSQCQTIFASQAFYSVEFRQCSTGEGLAESLRECQSGFGPHKLKISCTQQEFANLAEGLRDNLSIRELELQLHFIFNSQDMQRLVSSLQCQEMETLVLEYLDMDDEGWEMICGSLAKHHKLKTITLAFTDKFADAARRLTPERRRARSEAILKLAQSCKTLHDVNWPEFQQDDSFVPEIEKRLEENKASN